VETPDRARNETASPPDRASYRSGFFFGVVSFLGTAVLGLVSTIITSRLYGIEIIGEYALVMAPVGALGLLSSVKEQKALIKEITGLPARHPRVGQLFGAVFSFSWALSAAVGLLDAVVCWFVFRGPLHAPGLLGPTYASIASYVVVTNTNWNVDAIFSAFVAGRQLFWVRLHELVAFIAIATVAGLAWHSIWALVIATTGAALSSLLHRAWAARAFVRPRLSREEYRAGLDVLPELLRFGLKATPGQIAQGASQQGGIWALGVVASTSVVGAYSRALSLPQRLQQASLRITEVLYPTLVGRHSEGDGHGFDRALIDSIRYEVIGLLLIAAVLGGAAHSVLDIFGPGFGQAAPALVLLAIFPAMASITVAQTQALWAVNRPGLTSAIAIARLVVTIGLLIALTPTLGIVGPAIALLAGYLVVIVLSGIALRPSLKRPVRATWSLRERFALIAAYASGFGAAHWVESLTPSVPAGVILCVAAGALAYAVAFLLLGGLNDRDRHRLAELPPRLRARIGRQRAGEAVVAAGGDERKGGVPATAVGRAVD
jgi:O-antigen/teichoic acid export membrane protein